jgi:hypothetical protein
MQATLLAGDAFTRENVLHARVHRLWGRAEAAARDCVVRITIMPLLQEHMRLVGGIGERDRRCSMRPRHRFGLSQAKAELQRGVATHAAASVIYIVRCTGWYRMGKHGCCGVIVQV